MTLSFRACATGDGGTVIVVGAEDTDAVSSATLELCDIAVDTSEVDAGETRPLLTLKSGDESMPLSSASLRPGGLVGSGIDSGGLAALWSDFSDDSSLSESLSLSESSSGTTSPFSRT